MIEKYQDEIDILKKLALTLNVPRVEPASLTDLLKLHHRLFETADQKVDKTLRLTEEDRKFVREYPVPSGTDPEVVQSQLEYYIRKIKRQEWVDRQPNRRHSAETIDRSPYGVLLSTYAGMLIDGRYLSPDTANKFHDDANSHLQTYEW